MSKSKCKFIIHRTVLLEKLIVVEYFGGFYSRKYLVLSYDDDLYKIIAGDEQSGGLLTKSNCKRLKYNEWNNQ